MPGFLDISLVSPSFEESGANMPLLEAVVSFDTRSGFGNADVFFTWLTCVANNRICRWTDTFVPFVFGRAHYLFD